MTILSILRSGFFENFESGFEKYDQRGQVGVNLNPSSAGSGTGFDEVGGLLCFCALTLNAYCGSSMAFLQTYQLRYP